MVLIIINKDVWRHSGKCSTDFFYKHCINAKHLLIMSIQVKKETEGKTFQVPEHLENLISTIVKLDEVYDGKFCNNLNSAIAISLNAIIQSCKENPPTREQKSAADFLVQFPEDQIYK